MKQNKTMLIILLLLISGIIYSQTDFTLKHTQLSKNDTRGKITISETGKSGSYNGIKVKEVSMLVDNSEGTRVIFSADIKVQRSLNTKSNVHVAIKSYTEPDYIRDGSKKDLEEDEEDGQETVEEPIPYKSYLELKMPETELELIFYDKSELENIVEELNKDYDLKLKVSGSGRNLNVRNIIPMSKTEELSVTGSFNFSEEQITDGTAKDLLKFDLTKLQEELISDRILSKTRVVSYRVIVDPAEIYVNGNKIAESLLMKYRGFLNNLHFDFKVDE